MLIIRVTWRAYRPAAQRESHEANFITAFSVVQQRTGAHPTEELVKKMDKPGRNTFGNLVWENGTENRTVSSPPQQLLPTPLYCERII
jgi:hypothetical protein